jgi:hypothetical protein
MDRLEEVRAIKAASLTGDRRERFRAIDLMYKASRHDRERRSSFMLMLEQLIELAEAEGLGEFLQVVRAGIFGVHSLDDGSANPLFKATGRRIGVEEHARLRTSLAAAMDWLRRTPFDNEKAAREALRLGKKVCLGKVRNVTYQQVIAWRETLMAPSEDNPTPHFTGLDVARSRFLRLTCADKWPGHDNPEKIAKKILQLLVTEIPK